jgi:hypothetical protein
LPSQNFLENHCQIGADFREGKKDFYDAFFNLVQESGRSQELSVTMNSLGREMTKLGFCEVRTKALRYWGGIRLCSAAKEELLTRSEIAEATIAPYLQPQSASSTNEKPKIERPQVSFAQNPALEFLLLRAMGAL